MAVNRNKTIRMICYTCKTWLMVTFISSPLQAVYHNMKPASLQQQLETVHLNPEKAEMFSQAWASAGPELVEKLKHNVFAPKKVRLIHN